MKKKFALIIAAVLILLGIYYFFGNKKSSDTILRSIVVKKGKLDITLLATGTVQPENRLEIKAPVPGRMEEVLVKEGQNIKKGQILAWMSSLERAALLDAARAQSETEFKRWTTLYLPTPIMAPISGSIILRNIEPGQTFTNSDAIFIISDRLTVKTQVDETDISRIKLNQQASIALDAYPNQQFPGKVDQIAFDAKIVSSVTTYIVDVLPQKTPSFMRSGMTANVTFFIESLNDILLIPSETIKIETGQSIVQMKNAEGELYNKVIQLGPSDGKNTAVVSGLSEGDTIYLAEINLNRDEKKMKNPFSPMGSGHTPRR